VKNTNPEIGLIAGHPEIQLATIADLEDLLILHRAFRTSLKKETPSDDEFRSSLNRILVTQTVCILMARVGSSPAGYAAMHYYPSAWVTAYEAVIDDLYVQEKYRSHGIGRLLVEAMISKAKIYGANALHLDTNENNSASNRLYEKLGFQSKRVRWDGGRQIRYDLDLGV